MPEMPPNDRVMLAERSKDDPTSLGMVMNGFRFRAEGVTPEIAEQVQRTITRIMMAVNVHLDEADDELQHNVGRMRVFQSQGSESSGASLAAPTLKVKQYAVKTTMDQIRERREGQKLQVQPRPL